MERSGLRCRSSNRRRTILVRLRSMRLVTSMNPMLTEKVLRCILEGDLFCVRWAHTCSMQRARIRIFFLPQNSRYFRWKVEEGHHASCRRHQQSGTHSPVQNPCPLADRRTVHEEVIFVRSEHITILLIGQVCIGCVAASMTRPCWPCRW